MGLILYLIISIILSGIVFLCVVLYKSLLQKFSKFDYSFSPWLLIIFSLIIPLLDYSFIKTPAVTNILPLKMTDKLTPSAEYNQAKDLAVSVTRKVDMDISNYLYFIWILGTLLAVLLVILLIKRLCKIVNHSDLVPNNHYLNKLLENHSAHSFSKTKLYISNDISQPMTFWMGHHIILLPENIFKNFSCWELEHVVRHELVHVKRKDIYKLYILILCQIIFWFNPFIYLTRKYAMLECEFACDYQVLNNTYDTNAKNYGHTLIKCSTNINKTRFLPAIYFLSSKNTLYRRIKLIALKNSYKPTHYLTKMFISLCITCLVVSMSSFFQTNLGHASDLETIKPDNLKYANINLEEYFNGNNGSMVIYNITQQKYYIYNEAKAFERVSPVSTYKIFDSLIHLEERTISTEENVLKWDMKESPFHDWNQDQSLSSALNFSVNWYFQSLDEQINLSVIEEYLKDNHYGNENISGGIKEYWLESSLKISPYEQVEFLKTFYQGNEKFSENNMNYVKESLYISQGKQQLWGKNGTGIINGDSVNGWFIGGHEAQDNQYVFATNITGEQGIDGSKAQNITKKVFSEKILEM